MLLSDGQREADIHVKLAAAGCTVTARLFSVKLRCFQCAIVVR